MDKPGEEQLDQPSEDAQSPELLRKELVGSFTTFEKTFRIKFPLIWIATLLAPVVVSAIIFVVLGLRFGWEYPSNLVSHAFLTFFVFGRFIILFGTEGDAAEKYRILLSPNELFGLVTYLDFMTAMFVTFHMGILFRLPYVGEKIATLVWDGKFIMESQPWVKRVAYLGLVVFVIFPTSTTGSIGGSIFGRLLGMSRWLTVSGVLLGSILGNALMYMFANFINQYIDPENFWMKIVGIVIIVVLVILAEVRYRMVKQKYVDKHLGKEDVNTDS